MGVLRAPDEPPEHEGLAGRLRQHSGGVQPHEGVSREAEVALCRAFAVSSLREVQVSVLA